MPGRLIPQGFEGFVVMSGFAIFRVGRRPSVADLQGYGSSI
jgi:hypothetical protein